MYILDKNSVTHKITTVVTNIFEQDEANLAPSPFDYVANN